MEATRDPLTAEIVELARRRPCPCGTPAGATCQGGACVREREEAARPDPDGRPEFLPVRWRAGERRAQAGTFLANPA